MNDSQIVIYQSSDGTTKLDIQMDGDMIWLTQDKIAMLFGTQRPAITKHLGNIFNTKELTEDSVSSILEHTAKDGKKYKTKYYNIDAIIAVGYRVNSLRATHFRIWANQIIKEYVVVQPGTSPSCWRG